MREYDKYMSNIYHTLPSLILIIVIRTEVRIFKLWKTRYIYIGNLADHESRAKNSRQAYGHFESLHSKETKIEGKFSPLPHFWIFFLTEY